MYLIESEKCVIHIVTRHNHTLSIMLSQSLIHNHNDTAIFLRCVFVNKCFFYLLTHCWKNVDTILELYRFFSAVVLFSMQKHTCFMLLCVTRAFAQWHYYYFVIIYRRQRLQHVRSCKLGIQQYNVLMWHVILL